MTKEHPNISILKQFNPADPRTAAGVLADDFVWHYINPELPELAGDYIGLDGLTNFFERLAGQTNGSFKVNPVATVPIGDELVISLVKDSMVLEGKPMEIKAIVVWCIMGGKIKEAWDIPMIPTAKVLES